MSVAVVVVVVVVFIIIIIIVIIIDDDDDDDGDIFIIIIIFFSVLLLLHRHHYSRKMMVSHQSVTKPAGDGDSRKRQTDTRTSLLFRQSGHSGLVWRNTSRAFSTVEDWPSKKWATADQVVCSACATGRIMILLRSCQ